MDLNVLLHRYQVSVMQAAAATTVEARIAHHGRAGCYAERIATLQAATGALAPLSEFEG